MECSYEQKHVNSDTIVSIVVILYKLTVELQYLSVLPLIQRQTSLLQALLVYLSISIVMIQRGHVTYRRGLDWMTGFIDRFYTQHLTTVNYSVIAISTLYSSLLTHISFLSHHKSHPCNGFQHSSYTSLSLPHSMKSSLQSLIPFLQFLLNYATTCQLQRLSEFQQQLTRQNQSYFTTGCLPAISSSWRQLLETHDQRFFQVNPCGSSPYVTSSLTRRWTNSLLQTVMLITSRQEPHRKHRLQTIPLLLQRCVYLGVA
jgi:hypothetical protein